MANDEYTKLESFINGYLISLEEVADRTEKEAKFRTDVTTLGKTIYFADCPPQITYTGTTASINLGSVSADSESQLCFYISGSGFTEENVFFTIDDKKSISPYSINNDMYSVGGELDENTYEYAMSDSEILSGQFKVDPPSLVAKSDYSYKIFGGKNQLLCKTSADKKTVVPVTKDEAIVSPSGPVAEYSFYLIGASYIFFDFSEEPVTKNFDGYSLQQIKNTKFFRLSVNPGTAFSINTDGTIYATKETSSVTNDELYVVNKTPATDFIVYEYRPGEKQELSITANIYDAVEKELHIDYIAIKQISDIREE